MKRALALLAAVAVMLAVALLLFRSGEETVTPAPAAVASTTPAAATSTAPPRRARTAGTNGAAPEDSASPADTERFDLRVRVVAADSGEPVAGARVESEDREALTGADGEATLGGVPRGTKTFRVRARGFARAIPDVPAQPDGAPVVVVLKRGSVVPVEVVDAVTGRPIAGAELLPHRLRHTGSADETVTDAEGRAELTLLPSTAFEVLTSAAGHVPSQDLVLSGAPGSVRPTLRVELTPGGTLRGVVTDADGEPAVKAWVGLRLADGEDALGIGFTETDGTFVIDGLAYDVAYIATAHPQRRPELFDSAPAPVTVTAARPDAAVALRFPREGSLDLDVRDGDAPAEGVRASFGRARHQRSHSDMAGRATYPLAAGKWSLEVSADGRVPFKGEVEIAEDATVTKTIRLVPLVTISGTVVDEEGLPADNVMVATFDAAEFGAGSGRETRCDAEGRFTLRNLAPGPCDFYAHPQEEYEPTEVRGIVAPAENVRVVLTRRGVLQLRLAFEGNAREDNTFVSFRAKRDDDLYEHTMYVPHGERGETPWPADMTGEVRIRVPGYVPVTRTVSVPAGTTVDLGEIRLAPTVRVTGVVRDADGRPVPRAGLVACGLDDNQHCSAGEDGSFELGELPPGKVTLQLANDPRATFRVDAPRDGLVLVVPRSGMLRVVVKTAAGAPAAGRDLVVSDANGWTVADGPTDEYGNWNGVVPVGRCTVVVENGPRGEIDVRADDVTVLRLR